MCRVFCWLIGLMVFSNVAVANTAPALSAAYAEPAAGLVASLEEYAGSMAEELDGTEPAGALSDESLEKLGTKYFRGRKEYRLGLGLVLASVGVVLVGRAAFFFGLMQEHIPLAQVSLIGVLVGLGGYMSGGILISGGAIKATRAVNGALGSSLSVGLGWAGVLLSVGGIVATPFFWPSLTGPLVATLFATMQLQIAKREVERAGLVSLHLTPTGNGLAVVGRF